jgi:hypothetical protein
VNPYQSPGEYRSPPSGLPAGPSAPIVHTTVELGDLFSRTWTVFKDQYGMCLALYLATFGLSFAANIAVQIVQGVVQVASHDPSIVVAVTIVVMLAQFVFGIWIGLGQVRGMISIARGQPTSIGVLFSGGPYLGPSILASIVLGLVVAGILLVAAAIAGAVALLGWQAGNERMGVTILGALVLAVVPLNVVILMFSQFQFLIVDRNADAMGSLGLSRQITNGNKLTLFVSYLLIGLLAIAGLLTCGIGLLFGVGPFAALLLAMFYLAMSGQTTADQLRQGGWQNPTAMPPTTPPSPFAGV